MRPPFAATLLLLAACTGAAAQGVALAGRMGERALIVVDGRPHTVAPGQSVAGVRLVRWDGDAAVVEHGAERLLLRPGATQQRLDGGARPAAGREIVIAAGSGGHFVADGTINGRGTRFMVDTGATQIALSREEAERLGVDLAGARLGRVGTANGNVPALGVTLRSVRLGDVEVANVAAVVLPTPMPYVLLGNSFLSRFQMRRENDVMRLELR